MEQKKRPGRPKQTEKYTRFGLAFNSIVEAKGLTFNELALRVWGDARKQGHITSTMQGKGEMSPEKLEQLFDELELDQETRKMLVYEKHLS